MTHRDEMKCPECEWKVGHRMGCSVGRAERAAERTGYTELSDIAETSPRIGLDRPDSNPKSAFGVKKPALHLIPQAALAHEAMAMADGAAKYGPYNWRENAVAATVYVSAAMRHLAAYLDGENIDPASKVHHLGHARACMALILDGEELGNLIDDRPAKGPAADTIRRLTRE